MKCPSCGGGGKSGPVYVDPGYGRRGWWEFDRDCFRCRGKGDAPDEMADWIVRGKAMRKARVERGESLRDAAQRMGLTTPQLSAMENGRIAPANAKLWGSRSNA